MRRAITGLVLSVVCALVPAVATRAQEPRFLPQGAQVYDRKTGLTWQRCTLGQQWRGERCDGTATPYTWDVARTLYRDGWRLPTMAELETLIDPERKARRVHPNIDTTLFPYPTVVPTQSRPLRFPFYWSSVPTRGCISQSRRGCAYVLDLYSINNTDVDNLPREALAIVRLVKAAPASSPGVDSNSSSNSVAVYGDRFEASGNEVLDRRTGLRWQRCNTGQTWQAGLGCTGVPRYYTYDDAARAAGGGWRLPTKDELMSLVEKGRPLHIDTDAFLDVHKDKATYWTSTPYVGGGRQYFCVNFPFGDSDNCDASGTRALRLVRDQR
ncbi:DUF1566 domain-containing protein [Gloeobacter kilaueensis]|uniref:Lcl C-terminal domain-containing protein n=1 Tax=Gloeobacter kilaueensis (strain ATCC BAA-2537 / CCAP 1431/1 / ULC 316 / JS1) TaxID=1183438 RepID=U5QFG8_GLOK1|nr:DUF1566 domain-containing protein [Gloeobacter kilaueensis]AGY57628.1 hypothetical protein GKIL_1382 [Gloeobacter kilaueensis JS1]